VVVIDQYLNDLKDSLTYASKHPEETAKGNAALYGLMARIPFRGMVEKSVRKIMEDLYSVKEGTQGTGNFDDHTISSNQPAWMGPINRILSKWSGWKYRRKK
jgi:hypothetical protein